MSYTYLQAQGAESSAECFSDIDPSVRSRLSLTAANCSCSGSGTESCPGFPFGTTCGHSTESPGLESSMSFAADSRAKILALPEREQESTANDPGYGAKWPESLAKFDLVTSSWRTRQLSFLEDSGECLATFPKWGSMHGGELFRRPTPVLRTCEKGSGFWPTPKASIDGTSEKTLEMVRAGTAEKSLMRVVKMPDLWPTPEAAKANNDISLTCSRDGRATPNKLGWAVAAHRWPTPRTQMTRKVQVRNVQNGHKSNLEEVVAIRGNPSHSQPTATTTETGLFADLNTPKNRDWKGQSQRGIHGPMDSLANLDQGDGTPIGGQLNPTWVEWLMGWPLGWTDLKPLETDRFRQWLRSHGAF